VDCNRIPKRIEAADGFSEARCSLLIRFPLPNKPSPLERVFTGA
jgi:hypothetical protein